MKKSSYVIHPIRTKADYQAALRLVEPYFDNEPAVNSDAGAHFEALVTLIEAYEAKHYPIAAPDPLEAIKFRMEQQGLKPKDLEPMIGQFDSANRLKRLKPMKRSQQAQPLCRWASLCYRSIGHA